MEISGFKIIEKIGQGGMASVWKAHQLSLDRTVAIKILDPHFARNPDEVKAFIQEARAAAALSHPNAIQVYDVAEEAGKYFVVMEYVGGPTVGEIIERNGTIAQRESLKIARVVASVLENAWDRSRMIHRDIKPDNVMVDEDGTVKVADLGLARNADPANLAAQLRAGEVEGTPNYMSPEQAACSIKQDCRTDMYSLGASLYHMVTGHAPFRDHTPMQIIDLHGTAQIPNPRDVNPHISVGVSQLITKLMMKDPEERYPDWPTVIEEIRKVAAGRILLQKSAVDTGSTIAPPATARPAPVRGISQRAAGAAATRRQRFVVPLWAHLLVWALLLAWWTVLALSTCRRPLPPPRAATGEAAPATPSPANPAE